MNKKATVIWSKDDSDSNTDFLCSEHYRAHRNKCIRNKVPFFAQVQVQDIENECLDCSMEV